MSKIKLVSWNVNGIRAAINKGFVDWFEKEQPDILGVQETKAMRDQLDEEWGLPAGYKEYWNSAVRKGYSGVASFSKKEPNDIKFGFGEERFDKEGRVIELEYDEFSVFNIYFPNGQKDDERLQYKMDFYDKALEYFEDLRKQGKKLIVFGDYNTAHKPIDLKNPKSNEDRSGFLPIERAWLDKIIDHGYVDIFRKFHPDEEGQYTWWTYRFNARANNTGWRIDYFFVTEDLVNNVTNAYITPHVMGSDHCPIVLELDI